MSTKGVELVTPVGRLVWGSLYTPQTKDAEGKPLVIKNGPDAGKPTQKYSFGVAIPKGSEQHWANTTWGSIIWNAGHSAFPAGQGNSPAFAWKVKDGDSQIPNRRGKKPCEQEGHAGHWILSFSSSFPPHIFNANGTQELTAPDAVKCGYYVQVKGSVAGNNSPNQPGVFLNHNLVALAGIGTEISQSVDASQVGFGQSPLPAGAQAVPAGFGQSAASAAFGGTPAVPAVPTTPAVPATPAPNPNPHYAILNSGVPAGPTPAPAPAPAPTPAAVPAAPAGPVMTAAANGITYEAYRQAGWSDEQLRAAGMLL